MVRIGIPRRPGPVLSTTTLYPPPNTSSNVANKPLYGVQLYGPDAPHIRFAATRYATEARRLLQSLLPSSSTPQKTANIQRIDGTTNRALVYAAESRRLLSTAQALEAAAGRSFPPWVPPSNKPYFSCALNVIRTELSVADAAVADQFVYYARQANGGDASKGDNKTEICEYECQRIIAAQVPDLADRYSDMENKRKVRGLNIGRSANLRRLVVGLAALAAIGGMSGYTVRRHRLANSTNGRGGDVSASTASDWNDAAFYGTSTPTASPTMTVTPIPTMEPTTQMAGAIGSTVSTIQDLRSNPWALGAIAGALSFIVLGFLAVLLLKRDSGKSDEPLLNAGIDEKEMPPAAVAVAVTEVVEEDAALSDDDRIAKEKVRRMVEAEERARRIQAAAGVRFRSGDDSLVSDTGVPIVPQYSRADRREYTPPPTVAPEGIEGDADRSLPPLRLQK